MVKDSLKDEDSSHTCDKDNCNVMEMVPNRVGSKGNICWKTS